jgi:dienelactone hydrolase
LQPTDSTGNQKHPLVVGIMGNGEIGYTWDRFAQTIASCGGYFVCMDRRGRGEADQWAEDAFCAYEFLSKHFDVDTNNVYALGISAGTYPVSQLLDSKPDIWKGAILFSAHGFPASDQIRVQSISLDVGAQDFDEVQLKALLKSQDELAAEGIRPILTVHPGVGHIVRKISLERERMKQIVAFIHQP